MKNRYPYAVKVPTSVCSDTSSHGDQTWTPPHALSDAADEIGAPHWWEHFAPAMRFTTEQDAESFREKLASFMTDQPTTPGMGR